MMTKKTSRFTIYFKQLAVIPVLACILFLSCESNDAEIYDIATIDSQAEYPGGMMALYGEVSKNLQLPKTDTDINAKVFIYFVVETNGSMSDIKVTRDPGYGLGDEAKRVLESLDKKWTPGMKDNKPVRMAYTLPISINIKSQN